MCEKNPESLIVQHTSVTIMLITLPPPSFLPLKASFTRRGELVSVVDFSQNQQRNFALRLLICSVSVREPKPSIYQALYQRLMLAAIGRLRLLEQKYIPYSVIMSS